MPCGGCKKIKKTFSAKVSKAVKERSRRRERKRKENPPQNMIEVAKKTMVDGIPFATIPDEKLEARHRRIKNRAITEQKKQEQQRLAKKASASKLKK